MCFSVQCRLLLLLLTKPFVFLFAFAVSGHDSSIELLNLIETPHDISHGNLPLAVAVSAENLNGVSSTILMAETWLRANVLAHYPASKITNVVVGSSAFCQQHQKHNQVLVLTALKNVYHSLKRWGLEREIKVSVAFYLSCLSQNSPSYEDDLKNVKPLVEFLHSVNSTFSVISHSGFSDKKSLSLVSSQLESMKRLGFFFLNNINILAIVPKRGKTIARKLSVVDSSLVSTLPLKPTPMPEIAEPPLVGNPNPAPEPEPELLPPLAQVVTSPPPMSPSSTFAPPQEQPSPFIDPASSPSPHGFFTLPPCNPIDNGSPSPYPHMVPVQKLWCVAKPSVPEETLQQALDYACGEGGADCTEIAPQGNCYNPDTLVAHASYAFNSYWQKHKRNGGTCSFGGTALLVHSDPSEHIYHLIACLVPW